MKTLRSFLAAFFAVSVLTATAFAADPSGTWKWTSVTTHGGPAEVTAVLKVKAGALTGTVTGRQGPAEIADASVNGSQITFTVTRTSGIATVVFKYTGEMAGDTIIGTIERTGPTVDTPPTKTDWKATRTK
jgi:hypothetical protein